MSGPFGLLDPVARRSGGGAHRCRTFGFRLYLGCKKSQARTEGTQRTACWLCCLGLHCWAHMKEVPTTR